MKHRPASSLPKNKLIMDIKIKKAKLSRSGTVEAVYIDSDGNEIALKGTNKCHNDLRVAFSRLVPFFTDLTEQKEAGLINWDNLEGEETVEALRKMDVTGLSIGGSNENPFITMTGRRTLNTSRILNLNAPGVEMNSETFEWEHIDDFDIAVQAVVYEVHEYIVNRKWEVAQLEINFEGDPDDPFGQADPTQDIPSVEVFAESVA